MAEVSYLQLHLNDDHDHHDGYDDRDEFVNTWSHDLHGFDFDCPYSHDFFPQTDENLFNRENQVNFVIDMFHQSVEQSCVTIETDLCHPDDRSTFWKGTDVNDLEAEFELGFHVEEIINRNDFSNCNVDRETEIDESNLQIPYDAFLLEDDNNHPNYLNLNPNVNNDFEWEEIDHGRFDDTEVSHMIFESEPDDDASDLPGLHPNSYDPSELDEEQPDPFEVLLNVHNIEANPDLATGGDNFTAYEMLFGQFADNNASSSSGQPPASTMAIENLLSVVITDEDVEKNDTHCAVCKDEIGTGLMAKQLPCSHRYHGDCIVQWLGIHNTCPLCRHELLTDDPDYERKKAERVTRDL